MAAAGSLVAGEARPSRVLQPVLAALALGAACGALAVARPEILTLNLHWSRAVALAAVAGLALLLASFRFPIVGVVAVLVLVTANLSEILVRVHGLPSALQLVVPALALSVLLRRLVRREASAPREAGVPAAAGFAMLGACYVGLVALSATWARVPSLTWDAAAVQAKAAALGVVVAWAVDDTRGLRTAAWTMALVGAVLALLSSWQDLTKSWDRTFGGLARVKQAQIVGIVFSPRATGPLADPNFYAQVLLALVPLALALALTETRLPARLLAIACAATLVLGVLTTYSRGGALALGFGLALAAASEWRRLTRRHLAWAAAFALVVVAAAPGLFASRLKTLSVLLPEHHEGVQEHDASVNKRRMLMATAAVMGLAHPVLGVGAGNYDPRFEEYAERVGAESKIYQDPGERAFPHSLYLELFAETGLVGLALFLAVAAYALASALRAARAFAAASDPRSALLARFAAIAVASYLASSLILHGDYIRYLWVFFGVAVACRSVAARASVAARLAADPVS